MAQEKRITFVLHDETINTHGFRMLTAGANLEEFRKNPLVDAFLNAELDFCRMIQEINGKIVEAVNFE